MRLAFPTLLDCCGLRSTRHLGFFGQILAYLRFLAYSLYWSYGLFFPDRIQIHILRLESD
jgi:hypothetical protein